jgi:uncharacterized Fe-S center protein
MAYRITEDCLNRRVCIDQCPEGAIKEGTDKSNIDPEKCTECCVCIDSFSAQDSLS